MGFGSYILHGGPIKDLIGAVAKEEVGDTPETQQVLDKLNAAYDKQNQKLIDAATWCAQKPGECALRAADWVPGIGTAARCAQWAIQGIQGHVGEDTAFNCIENAVGDVVGFATAGSGKYLFKASLVAEREGLKLAEREAEQATLDAAEREAQRRLRQEAERKAAQQRRYINLQGVASATAKDTAAAAAFDLGLGGLGALLSSTADPEEQDEEQQREEEAFFNANNRAPTASAPDLALPMLVGAAVVLVIATASLAY